MCIGTLKDFFRCCFLRLAGDAGERAFHELTRDAADRALAQYHAVSVLLPAARSEVLVTYTMGDVFSIRKRLHWLQGMPRS